METKSDFDYVSRKASAIDTQIESEVEHTQIDFINNNRVTSIIAMAIAAILIYYTVQNQVESQIFELWLVVILGVDLFRLYAAIIFRKNKSNNQVDYNRAKTQLYLGTFLSGSCWGSLAAILIPVVDEHAIIIVIFWLISIAMASTTTLSFISQIVRIFVFLVVTPLLIYLPLQEHLTGTYLIVLESAIVVLVSLLLKNAAIFSASFKHSMVLQARTRRHEQELIIQSQIAEQANNAKTEFLANMSHELRTPMHAILGFSSMGMQKTGSYSTDKISSYFYKINQSGERLLHLLNNLLDLSKLEAGRMNFHFTENDIQGSVNQIVNELAPLFIEHKITVNVEPTKVDTVAIYDYEKINQVIVNLISNAIKFTPVGRSINISFEEAKLYATEELYDENTVSNILVSIKDQGPGIPEDELKSVFDKFVQSTETKNGAGGTGLGLSISKEIIEGHNGLIFAYNSPLDGGAVFTFSIPQQSTHR